MKTVLYLIDSLQIGGAERSLLDISSKLRSYRPVICHLYPKADLRDEFIARGLPVYSLNIPPPYHWRQAIKSFSAVVKEVQPHLIHSSLFKSDIVARIVASRQKIPLINSLVNNSYHPSRFFQASIAMKAKLKMLQFADGFTSKKVDLFISNSETIKRTNADALGIPLQQIKVVYRGRRLTDFTELDERQLQTLVAELDLDGRVVFLNVSRLLERKGQIDLIRAFRSVVDCRPEALLLIAGEGSFKERLTTEICALGLSEHVRMLGSRRDIPYLLRLSNFFVFPSHYEGLPGSLIEAMMAEVPIIASGIGENMECVNTNSAFVHQPGNVNDLARAILEAMAQPERAAKNKQIAFEIAKDKFQIENISNQYEAVYDGLMNG